VDFERAKPPHIMDLAEPNRRGQHRDDGRSSLSISATLRACPKTLGFFARSEFLVGTGTFQKAERDQVQEAG
jgi:hypothetical protein